MPELPEVETVRRGLAQGVAGRTVDRVEVHHPRAVRRHVAGADDFRALLEGRTLGAAQRRGKYLWVPLDSGDALTGHLGMSGQLLVQPPETPDQPHLRLRFTFRDGGRELRFVDQRTLGGVAVVAGGATLSATVAHIAREPLDPLFDDEAFVAGLRRRTSGVKRALLDQTLVSGIGNIYADEALWRTRLHGGRATEQVTRPRARELLGHVRDVLRASLEEGGTSFDALYVSVNGVSGRYQRSLDAYGREGEPCRRCGTPIRREAFMGRSSYSCPRCQPRPRTPR